NLRDRLPKLSPTVVANLTAPVLRVVAEQLANDEGQRGRVSGSNSGEASGGPPPLPHALVCSGLLPSELDDIAAAFAPFGLNESDRRIDGDWAALLLRT
ncbi:MAG: hypothetical protein ACRDLL_15740, partial [Solirubrobacterales bacterium]